MLTAYGNTVTGLTRLNSSSIQKHNTPDLSIAEFATNWQEHY
jgi:hypothetical protein